MKNNRKLVAGLILGIVIIVSVLFYFGITQELIHVGSTSGTATICIETCSSTVRTVTNTNTVYESPENTACVENSAAEFDGQYYVCGDDGYFEAVAIATQVTQEELDNLILLANELQLEIEETSVIINNLQITLDQKIQMVESLTQEISLQAQYINELSDNLEEKAYYVSQLQAENENQARLISEMEESFANQGEIINNLNLTIQEDAELISNMELSLEDQAILVNELRLTIEEEQEMVILLQEKLNNQKEINKQLQEELDSVQQREDLTPWIIGLSIAFALSITYILLTNKKIKKYLKKLKK